MSTENPVLKLALPKGRMADNLLDLLADAGIKLRVGARQYRPSISLPDVEVKILKPQTIVEMLHVGSRDLGFTGADWVRELAGELVELVDTGLDPVRLVAAAPHELLTSNGRLPDRQLLIAAEYENLTRQWIADRGLNARFVRSFGATEVHPPEDADAIIDITATGATLRANGLAIFDELMTSSTRLFANPRSLENPALRPRIDQIVLLLESVLAARRRVMVELNVAPADLDRVLDMLPCMREPTIAKLHHEAGYAVRAAVPREQLPALIPALKSAGGTDIVVSELSQIVA